MPTFDDPTVDGAEASAALRGLAHASRSFADPADTYSVLGDLLAGVRSLRQVLDQLATTHLTHRARAHDDAGDQAAGATAALAAADELHQAATLLDGVHDRLNAAMSHSGRIAWHETAEPAATERAPSRWISVVFLDGAEADKVLDLIARHGTDAAIEHSPGTTTATTPCAMPWRTGMSTTRCPKVPWTAPRPATCTPSPTVPSSGT